MNGQQLSSNIISTLPQTIIENILCLLPIEEAARTSILSRAWRYKWTTIPKLVFRSSSVSERTTEEKQPSDLISARKNMDHRCKLFYAIHQVLLLRQGPIHEFTLFMGGPNDHCFEIDQIILHLARNHKVKKLKLHLGCIDDDMYKLPLCAFSLHQLTDLDLCGIDFNYQPMFSGFGSLRSLCFTYVTISIKDLLHLLSNCPSLKSFSLLRDPKNNGFKDCTIVELFKCLPVIEHLTIFGHDLSWLVLDSVPAELPTLLIHLKYFCFNQMWFDYDQELFTFLAVLIKCSPNLEKLKLEICASLFEASSCYGALKEFSDVRFEHLDELEIQYIYDCEPEMEFVKFILARSPKLKKVSISVSNEVGKDDMLEMLKILLRAPRVSPVEIVVW